MRPFFYICPTHASVIILFTSSGLRRRPAAATLSLITMAGMLITPYLAISWISVMYSTFKDRPSFSTVVWTFFNCSWHNLHPVPNTLTDCILSWVDKSAVLLRHFWFPAFAWRTFSYKIEQTHNKTSLLLKNVLNIVKEISCDNNSSGAYSDKYDKQFQFNHLM